MPALWVDFVSFATASMVTTIGLETFEGASVGVLSLIAVSVEAALAATPLAARSNLLAPDIARSLPCAT